MGEMVPACVPVTLLGRWYLLMYTSPCWGGGTCLCTRPPAGEVVPAYVYVTLLGRWYLLMYTSPCWGVGTCFSTRHPVGEAVPAAVHVTLQGRWYLLLYPSSYWGVEAVHLPQSENRLQCVHWSLLIFKPPCARQ